MAHNPSYVGKTHVVLHYIPHDAEYNKIVGVHHNYKDAKEAADKHASEWNGSPITLKALGTKGNRAYIHPDHDPGDTSMYEIHREGPNGYEKV